MWSAWEATGKPGVRKLQFWDRRGGVAFRRLRFTDGFLDFGHYIILILVITGTVMGENVMEFWDRRG